MMILCDVYVLRLMMLVLVVVIVIICNCCVLVRVVVLSCILLVMMMFVLWMCVVILYVVVWLNVCYVCGNGNGFSIVCGDSVVWLRNMIFVGEEMENMVGFVGRCWWCGMVLIVLVVCVLLFDCCVSVFFC